MDRVDRIDHSPRTPIVSCLEDEKRKDYLDKKLDKKREDYLNKNEYYCGLATLISKKSRDPNTQVGACIVNPEGKVVSLGCNGMPGGCDGMPWLRNGTKLETKYVYVCHAVLNAVVNKNSFDVKDCTIFTTQYPCNECAKIIIQSGISKLIFIKDKYGSEENKKYNVVSSKKMFDVSGVQYLNFRQLQRSIMKGIKVNITKTEHPESPYDISYERVKCESSHNAEDDTKNEKPKIVLDDDSFFMHAAILSAFRSKDPVTQVGACVVKIVNEDKKIVGFGYNGMPKNCNDDQMPWGKSATNQEDSKHSYVCHAELNAIMNKNSFDVKDCTVYVTLFPCNECAKLMIQSGIKKVVYLNDKDKDEMRASKRMLEAAKVELQQFAPKQTELFLEFQDK